MKTRPIIIFRNIINSRELLCRAYRLAGRRATFRVTYRREGRVVSVWRSIPCQMDSGYAEDISLNAKAIMKIKQKFLTENDGRTGGRYAAFKLLPTDIAGKLNDLE